MTKIRTLLISLLFALPASLIHTHLHAETKELDSIVAIVNDDIITRLELNQAFKVILKNLKQSGTKLPPAKILTKKVLDKLIMEKIQIDLAKRIGLQEDEVGVNRTIAKMASQNNLSLSEFINTLESQGVSFKQFRDDIKKQILMQRLQHKYVNSKVKITDQDIDNFLFNYKKSTDNETIYNPAIILTSIPEGSNSETIRELQKKSENIVDEIQNGTDFKKLAIEYSDASNALEGGNLGWRKSSELPSMVADIVPQLKAGETSESIKTPLGFIIVKLLDIKTASGHQIEEFNARHILIKTDLTTTKDQAKEKLSRLLLRVQEGESFSDIAKAHSQDKVSASKGGELGWFKAGDMVDAFSSQIKKLDPGQFSEVFESPFGFHIVQLVDKRKRDDSDEFLRSQAREALRKKKISEKKLYWLRQIRDEAHIDIKLSTS